MSKQPDNMLRHASPSERRMIARENLGFYHGVLVGAVYELAAAAGAGLDPRSARSFAGPLRRCVEQLPWLSVVVRNPQDEKKAGYAAVGTVDVEKHVVVLEDGGDDRSNDDDDEARWLEARLQPLLDGQWPADQPPWRVAVCPFPSRGDRMPSRCLVAFVFCHSIGDGLCGNIFHRVFLDALRQGAASGGAESTLIEVPPRALPAPFDTPERLPISWSFLLPPLIAVLLPKFLADWLGIRPHASTVDEGTWTGRRAFFDADTFCSRLRVVEIPAPLVARAARVARAHDAKMTGIVHQLVVRALSENIRDSAMTNFVSGTAVSLRPSVGATVGDWGNYASGCYGVHPRVDTSEPMGEDMWNSARAMTRSLAESATKREDQPLGLLRYAPSIRGWLQGKLGSRRDSSYEVSNLGVLDVADDDEARQQSGGYNIAKVIFAQPGNVLHAPIDFNLNTVKGGPMTIAVTWQEGALGVSGDEAAIVDGICKSLRDGFEGLQE